MATAETTLTTGKQSIFRSNAAQKLLAFAALIVIFVVFSILSPFFRTPENVVNILLATAVNGVLALGVTFIITTAGIDLSVGTVMTLSAVMTGLAVSIYGMPVPLGILVGVLTGATAGLINGLVISRMRIPPFIATLGMMVSARGLAKWWSNGNPISFPTESYAAIGKGMMPVLIFVLIAILFHFILRYTVYGKHTYAIGSNEDAARMSGIKVARHKVMVYAIAGLLAAVAAIVLSARNLTAQAGMGVMYELDAIAMAVIGGVSLAGGRGSILGTVLGALIFGVIISGFTFLRLDAYYQEMVKGAIIVGDVVLDQWRQRRTAGRA